MRRPFHGIVCGACLRDGRAQRCEYDLRTDRHDCAVHGPRVTGEAIWALHPIIPERPWFAAIRR